MSRIIDISQSLRPGIPVWPGDKAYEFNSNWVMEGDCPVNVGNVAMSNHTGTHADAPYHYGKDGETIDAVNLARYIGPCHVLDVRGCGALITPQSVDLPQGAQRILFRTYEAYPHDGWDSGFTAIHPDMIILIAERGGHLVGIDTPSIDPEQSKTMDAHKAVLANQMSILEGLVLDHVSPGEYELIALPLKIAGGDASPVRAVLRELD